MIQKTSLEQGIRPKEGFHRILVGTDFSPHSRAALAQALWLARKTGASITLVHTLPDLRQVVHSASYRAKLDLLYGEGNEFQREVRRESDSRMRQLVEGLHAQDVTIQTETLLGEPYVELTHAVQKERYDLVLAGTHGMTAWERIFVGSTAKRLIRKCPCSVWIAKDERTEPPRIVLAATDFSDASHRALEQAVSIASFAPADLHVLHVVDSGDIPPEIAARIPTGEKSLREMVCDEAKHRLEGLIASLQGGSQIQVHAHLTWGTPWKEIGRLSQHLHADLVAMGTVGRSGVRGLLLGNTAERVLTHCEASVLSVKPADFVSPILPAAWPLHP